jgi:putative CocE/NonD family hydrolase
MLQFGNEAIELLPVEGFAPLPPGDGVYAVDEQRELRAPAADAGVELAVAAFAARPKAAGERFPLVVMPTPFGAPRNIYAARAKIWAELGYAVIVYEPRGFWLSQGHIDLAGLKDQADISAVLDYCLGAKSPVADCVDAAAPVAFAGVSYGAGVALLAPAVDRRVACCVSMSGFDTMVHDFYTNESPNSNFVKSLEAAAKVFGDAPQATLDEVNAMVFEHRDFAKMAQFMADRAPASAAHVAALNARAVPVFFAQNYGDTYFLPQNMLTFFARLTAPGTRFVLGDGGHAAEMLPSKDRDNKVWAEATAFLDCHLKGKKHNGSMDAARRVMALVSGTADYVSSAQWPPTGVATAKLYLTPRGKATFGGLSAEKPRVEDKDRDLIRYGRLPDGFFGTVTNAVVSLGGLLGPVSNIWFRQTNQTIAWTLPTRNAPMRVCGTPALDFTFRPTWNAQVPPGVKRSWQVYGYVYVVKKLNYADEVGNFAFTYFNDDEQPPPHTAKIETLEDGFVRVVGVPFHPICVDVAAGHQLAVGIALCDKLFAAASTQFQIEVDYQNSYLTLPLGTAAA